MKPLPSGRNCCHAVAEIPSPSLRRSPMTGLIRDGSSRAAGDAHQRSTSRTRTTTRAAELRWMSLSSTGPPSSPVAPVTKIVDISGLHRKRGPMGAEAVGEEQQTIARLHVTRLEGITEVDEVVAGARVAVAGDVARPQPVSADAEEAHQNRPTAHADVVWKDPADIGRLPSGAGEHLRRDVPGGREVRRDDLVPHRVAVPVVAFGDLGRTDDPIPVAATLDENRAGGVGGAVVDRLAPGIRRTKLRRDAEDSFRLTGEAHRVGEPH